MQIGSNTYAVQARPDDLDAQLLALTGCSAAEVAGWLGGHPIAGLVAAALLPFLAEQDRPAAPDLAQAIADAGVAEVAAEVAALYAADLPALAEPVEGDA
jgi:hypothetical protein